ncbi:MAG: hypothetical protein QM762_12490 [Chryseolinea sp.]
MSGSTYPGATIDRMKALFDFFPTGKINPATGTEEFLCIPKPRLVINGIDFTLRIHEAKLAMDDHIELAVESAFKRVFENAEKSYYLTLYKENGVLFVKDEQFASFLDGCRDGYGNPIVRRVSVSSPMLTLFNLYHQDYPDGGILVIRVWKDEAGVPSKTYSLQDDKQFRPKPGKEGDIAYTFNNFCDRPLSELWERAIKMMEPV